MESPFNIVIKWNSNTYDIKDVHYNLTVEDLKLLITQHTNVLPERQKLLNLKFKGLCNIVTCSINSICMHHLLWCCDFSILVRHISG